MVAAAKWNAALPQPQLAVLLTHGATTLFLNSTPCGIEPRPSILWVCQYYSLGHQRSVKVKTQLKYPTVHA